MDKIDLKFYINYKGLLMARYFELITIDELKNKIMTSCIGCEWVDYKRLSPTVEKDFEKVKFDTENINFEQNDKNFTGFHLLPNGLAIFSFTAGGDWETGVWACIYFDGKKLRGYIPLKGNLWNTDTNEAYGNDDEADLKNARKRWPDDKNLKKDKFDIAGYLCNYDIEAIKADIMERIKQDDRSLPVYKPLNEFTNKELLGELKRRLGN